MQQRAFVVGLLVGDLGQNQLAHLNWAYLQGSLKHQKGEYVLADDLGAVGDAGGPALLRILRLARQTRRAIGLLQLGELLPSHLVQGCLITA